MIRIKIGSEERKYNNIDNIDESWIVQQVNRRQADGQDVCVEVHIKQGSVEMGLSTPACSKSGGGARTPTPQEGAIFDLWERQGLRETNFSGGNVVAFFKQLRKLLD